MNRSLYFGLLFLVVSFCGLVGCHGNRSEEIKAVFDQWQGAIAQGKFEEAYLLMAEEYRAKTTLEQFRDRYSRFSPPPLTRDAVVHAKSVGGSIVPAPRPDVGTVNGELYGVTRVSNVWRFTGVDGGYVHIIGDK